MKCKRIGCSNETKNNDFAYCSRDCAPYGRLGEEDSRSDRTAGSGTAGPGAPSPASSSAASKQGRLRPGDTASAGRSTASQSEMPTRDGWKTSALEDESNGIASPEINDESTMPTEGAHTESTAIALRENSDATQLLDFVAPSPSSGEETLRNGNLIDSTLMQLHGLMRSVSKDVPSWQKANPQMIQAVCNAAKQMKDLMKLKLDVAKEAKKLSKVNND